MPNYEYCCKACGAVFTRNMSVHEHDYLASILAQTMIMTAAETDIEAVRCPRCHDIRVERRLSTFFPMTSKKS